MELLTEGMFWLIPIASSMPEEVALCKARNTIFRGVNDNANKSHLFNNFHPKCLEKNMEMTSLNGNVEWYFSNFDLQSHVASGSEKVV